MLKEITGDMKLTMARGWYQSGHATQSLLFLFCSHSPDNAHAQKDGKKIFGAIVFEERLILQVQQD